MAVRTDSQLADQISDLLADNTAGDISADDLRSVLTDIRDSLGPPPVVGLPNPSEDYEGRVVINVADRREYVCENDPVVGTSAVAAFHNLRNNSENVNYYQEDDADLRVFHDLPAATSSDDDTWIYIDSGAHRDKFYFGDTAPGGTYHWYEDSPRDALIEVCLAFADGEDASVNDLGQNAPVVYMGQHQDDDDARDWTHRHTIDLTTTYYVYWSISEQAFKIIDTYSVANNVTDHWRWRDVRSEALNPIYRPNLDGSFPDPTADDFAEQALLIDHQGINWHVKHTMIGTDQSARGTWTGYSDGDTVPGLFHTDSWRGVVDNTGQVSSPSNRDVCGVKRGSHLDIRLYLTAGNPGWLTYRPFDRNLGVFDSLELADGAVGHFSTGDEVYCAVGYQLYGLTSFTPGTTTTHVYTWERAAQAPLTARGAYLAELNLQEPSAANDQISAQSAWTLQNTAPSGWEIRSQGRLRTPALSAIQDSVVGFWVEAWHGTTLSSRTMYALRRFPNTIDGVSTGFFHVSTSGVSRVIPQIISYVGGFFEIEFYCASQATTTAEFQRINDGTLRIYEWLG